VGSLGVAVKMSGPISAGLCLKVFPFGPTLAGKSGLVLASRRQCNNHPFITQLNPIVQVSSITRQSTYKSCDFPRELTESYRQSWAL